VWNWRTIGARSVVAVRQDQNSVREVPLTGRALAALDTLPTQLTTRLLFTAPQGGPLNLSDACTRSR
jgi:hypothetical protein